MQMDVNWSSTLGTLSIATPNGQPLFTPAVHSFVRGFSCHRLEDLKTISFCSVRDVLKSRHGWDNSKGTIQFPRAALKEEGAGSGADDGVAPPKTSSEKNGVVFSPQTSGQTKVARPYESNLASMSKGGVTASGAIAASGANSNRAGLFRTPISGGVQSATSSHGLPDPAIAVRNLIEQARYAHLCTIMSRMHHRRRGYPFGSLVDFATDNSGHPLFSLSPLAIHTRNLLADPRCTLVVQIPGWSGLANARVTIFGDVYPLPAEQQERAHKHYIAKHQQAASHQWGNFTFYRMENISDIYFVGGFGTVAWVDVKEYERSHPDIIAANGAEQTLQELNTRFSRPIRELLSTEVEVDDAALISIDSKGVDIRVRQGAQFNVQRVSFEETHAVETLEQANRALQKILDRAAHVPGVV